MRAKDIRVGDRYLCRIGSEWREVIITQAIEDYYTKLPVFRVRRADKPLSGIQLKARRATALRPMPGSELARAEEKRLAKQAARPKSPRMPSPPHASQSTREYHAELRRYVAEVDAWADRKGKPRADKRVVAHWIRSKLQAHLTNRATWLRMTVLPATTPPSALKRAVYAYEKFRAVSRADCHVARMLGADPEIVGAIGKLVRE